MALAKKYKVNLTFNETIKGNIPTIAEVERDLKEISLAINTPQKLVFFKNGESRSSKLNSPCRVSSSWTETWSGGKLTGDDLHGYISVSVTYTFDNNSQNSCTIKSTYSAVDSFNYYTQDNQSFTFVGSSLQFSFKGTVTVNQYATVHVSQSGTITLQSGSGQLS